MLREPAVTDSRHFGHEMDVEQGVLETIMRTVSRLRRSDPG